MIPPEYQCRAISLYLVIGIALAIYGAFIVGDILQHWSKRERERRLYARRREMQDQEDSDLNA